MICSKVADKITKGSRISTKKCSETVEKETKYAGFNEEIAKDRRISPEERQG